MPPEHILSKDVASCDSFLFAAESSLESRSRGCPYWRRKPRLGYSSVEVAPLLTSMGVSFVSELSWLRAFSPTAALLCVGLVFAMLLVNRARWGALGDQFEHTLFQAIHSGCAKTFPDVLNLYLGIYQKAPNLNHRHGLTSRLRAFLVKLIDGTVGRTFQNGQWVGPNLTPEARVAWKELLSQLIRESEETASFFELPALEQNILKDILCFLDSNDDSVAKRKLSQLADSSIGLRDRELRRAQKINKWSITVAVISILLTVYFGTVGHR